MAVPALTIANNADYYRSGKITAGGVPYNLTGHTLAIEVRHRAQDATVYISIDSASLGGVVLGDQGVAPGQFTFYFPKANLAKMPHGEYVYDILMIQPSGLRQNLGIAPITVVDGVTRP